MRVDLVHKHGEMSFSGPNRPYLEAFLAFCRRGAFAIW